MQSIFQKINLILTLKCQRASQLTSESFERKLLRHEHVALNFHRLVCWSCRQYEKQLGFIRAAMQHLEQDHGHTAATTQTLEPAVKERLKQLKA